MVTEENPIRESPIAGPGAGEAGERFAKGETSAQGGFPSPEHKKEKEDPFRRSRKGKKKNRLTTDAVREVRFTFSRFLSILVLGAGGGVSGGTEDNGARYGVHRGQLL